VGLLITLSLIANKTTGYPLSTNCFYIMAVDLFPDFSSEYITTALGARIFVRVSPNKGKPPALLLHGFPQTHMEWHRVVPLLLPHYTVVLLDLRGYGASESIADSVNGSGYTKRLMAQDCVSVMDQLGYTKFTVIGHDRGARVTYRLAFDQPEKLEKVVLIDIIPTAAMFKILEMLRPR
jgi:haloacetate dehalogenase